MQGCACTLLPLLMPFPYRALNSPFLCLNKFSPEITYVCSHHCFLKWPHTLFSWNHTLRCFIILWYTHSGLLNKTIVADGEFFLVDCALKCCPAAIKSLLGHKYGFTGRRCVKSVIAHAATETLQIWGKGNFM